MSTIATKKARKQKKKAKDAAAHHPNVSGLPSSLVRPFLQVVAQELRMLPCKEGHAWCRGSYRNQEHFDAWQDAFHQLWTTMEKMTDLPERLVAPLATVVESRRNVPPVDNPKWDEWVDRDHAATWELFIALAEIDARCEDCQRKAIAELGL